MTDARSSHCISCILAVSAHGRYASRTLGEWVLEFFCPCMECGFTLKCLTMTFARLDPKPQPPLPSGPTLKMSQMGSKPPPKASIQPLPPSRVPLSWEDNGLVAR